MTKLDKFFGDAEYGNDWVEVLKYAAAEFTSNAVYSDMDKSWKSDGFVQHDIKDILYYVEGENEGDEWLLVCRVNTGNYYGDYFAAVRAGCDYTGWGCRESGETSVASTLEILLRFGLTVGERARLGLPEVVPDGPMETWGLPDAHA